MPTTLEKIGARVYLIDLPFHCKDAAKNALGMTGKNWDGDRRQWWVGAAKMADATKFVNALNGDVVSGEKPAAEDFDSARVYGKVKYQGRTYFVIAETRDLTRCRVITLDDGAAPMWVDCSACELLKRYEGRPERGAYGRETGRTVYQTLGGLRRFVSQQRNAEAAGVPQCAACGKRGQLVEDLEDGCMKCRGCCDMPAE